MQEIFYRKLCSMWIWDQLKKENRILVWTRKNNNPKNYQNEKNLLQVYRPSILFVTISWVSFVINPSVSITRFYLSYICFILISLDCTWKNVHADHFVASDHKCLSGTAFTTRKEQTGWIPCDMYQIHCGCCLWVCSSFSSDFLPRVN